MPTGSAVAAAPRAAENQGITRGARVRLRYLGVQAVALGTRSFVRAGGEPAETTLSKVSEPFEPVAAHGSATPVLVAAPESATLRALLKVLRDAQIGFRRADEGSALSALDAAPYELVIDGITSDFELVTPWRERLLELELPILTLASAADANCQAPARAGTFGHIGAELDAASVLDEVESALRSGHFSSLRRAATPIVADDLLVRSSAMRAVVSLLERVAPSAATVMIRGESGTGKEVVARRLHELSPRAQAPLVKVHCAALPEPILESELFGYERGAFTGAHARKPGRVELAEGGTLFLDEIGEIPLSVQVKLLRLLQDRQYERLGGTKTLTANVRFVTATHRNLEKMVRSGAFREDLYYRLNVVRVDLPPLRERRDDIEALALRFCHLANQETGRTVRIGSEAMARIVRADWRGNVRELQNFVERLVVLSESESVNDTDVIREQARALGGLEQEDSRGESSIISLDSALRRAERQALQKALRKANGNRALAARILGVSRRTLFYKLREHDLG